jgi:hypothetical protein
VTGNRPNRRQMPIPSPRTYVEGFITGNVFRCRRWVGCWETLFRRRKIALEASARHLASTLYQRFSQRKRTPRHLFSNDAFLQGTYRAGAGPLWHDAWTLLLTFFFVRLILRESAYPSYRHPARRRLQYPIRPSALAVPGSGHPLREMRMTPV